ncbi:serine protease [Mesorhizobium sp. KR9-304]|uniref:serine protease n=1 Tax=Mesorhizobium sp. KR9-304 TaxID=3156614 RepID=UPI0032B448EE
MKLFCSRALVVAAILAGSAYTGQAADDDFLDDFIVNGIPAAQGSWPWQVRILAGPDDKKGFCGGSLIRPRWVLTAAHCLQRRTKVAVGYGSVKLSELSVVAGDKIVIHPLYGAPPLMLESSAAPTEEAVGAKSAASVARQKQDLPPSPKTDIALIRLAEPLDLPTVALADGSSDRRLNVPGAKTIVIGWGATFEFKNEKAIKALYDKFDAKALQSLMDSPRVKIPEELRQAEVEIVDRELCRQVYGAASRIYDTEVCAGVAGSGRDSCYGDSGGPLTVRDPETQDYVQLGVVSWGKQCGHPMLPGIYARVGSFHEWIVSTIGEE